MNTHRSRTIATAVAVLLLLGFSDASVASAHETSSGPAPVRCQWTVTELPHSPDAVEGWYRGCPPSALPHSPTGVEGWTH